MNCEKEEFLGAMREHLIANQKMVDGVWYQYSIHVQIRPDDSLVAANESLMPVPDCNNQDIEELTQQKNNAYKERNMCLAAFAHAIHAVNNPEFDVFVTQHPEDDKEWEDDWRTILVIQRRDWQMTWHFHDSEKYLLKGLPVHNQYEWDGHTTEEKYQRLLKLFIGISPAGE